MLEEKDKSEDHGVTAGTQSCMTDEVIKSDVDQLLVLLPQTTWEKRDLLTKSFLNLSPKTLFKDYVSATAILKFFDDEVVEYLVNLTKLYAGLEKGGHSFNINQFEMRLFLGILMQSGNNVLPRKTMYWKNSTNVKSKSISNAMSRNRFEEIMKILLCCDNNNFTQTSTCLKLDASIT